MPIETIKRDIVEKITDYMCEVAQKHYEFNDITFEEMSDLMEKELATKLNEAREGAVRGFADVFFHAIGMWINEKPEIKYGKYVDKNPSFDKNKFVENYLSGLGDETATHLPTTKEEQSHAE